MSKVFNFTANVSFYADNIDDALLVLSKHLNEIHNKGLDAKSIFLTGSINVSEVNGKGEKDE